MRGICREHLVGANDGFESASAFGRECGTARGLTLSAEGSYSSSNA